MATKLISVSSLAEQVGMGTILLLRPKAAEMYDLSVQEYGMPLPGDIYICDMNGIEDCSGSFVDEFIFRWCNSVRGTDNAIFVVTNVTDDSLYSLEAALMHRNRMNNDSMVVLRYQGGIYNAIGDRMEKNVRAVFDLMADGKHITARAVAGHFELELNSAGNRLKKLYDAHLAMRLEQSIANGGKYEYYLPTI